MCRAETFVGVLTQTLRTLLQMPEARKALAGQALSGPELTRISLVLFATEMSYLPVHQAFSTNWTAAEERYGRALSMMLGLWNQRERKLQLPSTTVPVSDGDVPQIRTVLTRAAYRGRPGRFHAFVLDTPQDATERVRAAAADLKRARFVPAYVPHRADDGHAFLVEALWLHARACADTGADPQAATADEVGTWLNVLTHERLALALTVVRLSLTVRLMLDQPKIPQLDATAKILFQQVAHALPQTQLMRLLSAVREGRGARQAFERAAVDLDVRRALLHAWSRELQRADEQDMGLFFDDPVASEWHHAWVRRYLVGDLKLL